MTDARLVWDTWRRILMDDVLVDHVLFGRTGDPDVALSQAERAIVADYAQTRTATDSNIGMYRRGLARNALGALSLVPMTQQLFYTRGLDVEDLASEYAQADGYRDHGPNFWTNAAAFVAYLSGRDEFAMPAFRDVLALDLATTQIALRLGQDPAPCPTGAAAVADGAARFIASRAAAVISSCVDLTDWIVNPHGFDPDDVLSPTPHWWLVHFPPDGDLHGYAELSQRAAEVFDLLATPRTAAELAAASDALTEAEAHEVVGSLVERGVVCEIEAAPPTPIGFTPAEMDARERAECDAA